MRAEGVAERTDGTAPHDGDFALLGRSRHDWGGEVVVMVQRQEVRLFLCPLCAFVVFGIWLFELKAGFLGCTRATTML